MTVPALGETLTAFPDELSVTVDAPVRPGATLTVLDAAGAEVEVEAAVVDDDRRTIRAGVEQPPDDDGSYVLSWRADGDDGRARAGGSVFTVARSGERVVEANARVVADDGPDGVRLAGGAVFAVGAVLLVLALVLVRDRGPAPRRWLVPLGGALMLLGVGLVVVGALDSDDDGGEPVEVRATGDGASVNVTVTPAAPGFDELHVYVFDEDDRPLDVPDVDLTVTGLDGSSDASTLVDVAVPVVRAGDNHVLSYDAPLLFPGSYDLTVSATTADGAPVTAVATVEVR